MQEPLAVVGHAREVAVPPHVGPARPVRLEIALADRGTARASCPATASCTRARRPRRAPSGRCRRTRRPPCRARGRRASTARSAHDVRRQEARADLGAARDVDDRAAARRRRRRSTSATAPRSTARRSRRGRAATTGRARGPASSPCAISARISVGETPRIVDPMTLDERPEAVRPGIIGRAVVEHERAAVGERADDLPRPHDPTDVGEPEQPLAAAQVHLERDLLGDLHEEAAVHVHRALRPAGRAARVRDEQRMLAVDVAASKRSGRVAASSVERQVAPRLHRHVGATEARHDDDGVHRRRPARPRRRPSPSSARPGRAA